MQCVSFDCICHLKFSVVAFVTSSLCVWHFKFIVRYLCGFMYTQSSVYCAVNTSVEVRFHVPTATWISDAVKEKLLTRVRLISVSVHFCRQ